MQRLSPAAIEARPHGPGARRIANMDAAGLSGADPALIEHGNRDRLTRGATGA